MLHASHVATSKPWTPLLTGDLALRARHAASAVAHDIDRRHDAVSQRAFADMALVFGELAHAEQSDAWLDKTNNCLNRVVEQVSAGLVPRWGLHGGLCGVAWTITHLSSVLRAESTAADRAGAAEPVDDPVAAIDAYLLRRLQRGWTPDYDLISGIVGVGVYLLERLPRPAAEDGLRLIVDYLYASAESSSEGISWHTPAAMLPAWQRERAPNGYYNLGVAHGIPGILYLLGELARRGIETARVMALLEGAVDWLLARRQDRPSQFPSWYVPGMKPEVSRLGWCYGDLGVGAVLHVVANSLGRHDWLEAARSILDGCINFPADLAHIRDTGLCHGAGGVAHIFNRVYQTDPLPRYAHTAVDWYRRALDMQRPGEGFGGFPAHVGEHTAQADADSSFLAGSLGVALAFLAATTSAEPAWDRLLLLSTKSC
jgi:hypothetical protein